MHPDIKACVLTTIAGDDAIIRIAVIEHVNTNLDKLKFWCAGCGRFFHVKEMQLKKTRLKNRYQLSGRCRKCKI